MRISEIKMSSKRLAAQSQGSKASIGIEFELLVPRKNSVLIPDYYYNQQVTSIEEILHFFEINDINSVQKIRELSKQLDLELNAWARDQAEKQDITDDEYEEFIKEITENQQAKFLNDEGLNWTKEVYDWYDDVVDWPFYKEVEATTLEEMTEAAALFDKITGYKDTIPFNGHDGPREPGKFTYEKDPTVQHADGNAKWINAEIVSYPMAVDDIMDAINNVRSYAYKVNAKTNRTCGLHINISLPNQSQLDYLKLITLIGDEYVLNQFKRINNSYTPSAAKRVRASGKLASPEDQLKIADSLRAGDMAAAQRALRIFGRLSVNFHPDHIELRSPGGNWRDEPIEKIVDTVNRLVVALEAAVDPQAYRKEYITKAYKLIYSVRGPADKRLEDLTPIEQYRIGFINRSELAALMTRKQTPVKLPK